MNEGGKCSGAVLKCRASSRVTVKWFSSGSALSSAGGVALDGSVGLRSRLKFGIVINTKCQQIAATNDYFDCLLIC